jgi:hypothetical protein
VPHVHVHCLPRTSGDYKPNDKVYDAIDEAEVQEKAALERCCTCVELCSSNMMLVGFARLRASCAPQRTTLLACSGLVAALFNGACRSGECFCWLCRKSLGNIDEHRKPRTPQEMAAEAAELNKQLAAFLQS